MSIASHPFRFPLRSGALLLVLTAGSLSHADILGFRLSAYSWQQDVSGQIRADGTRVNLKHDLDIDDESNRDIELVLEHPLPLLPNVRLAHTRMDLSGRSVLNRTIEFDGTTFYGGTPVSSDLDLTHTDATFYYELLDNWLSLDVGLTVRHFSGDAELRSPGAKASADYATTLPLLYAAVRADLPLTGLYVGASGNAIHYSDSRLYDYRAHIGYETRFGLGAELGVRRFNLDYDDGGDEADVDIDGAYLGLFYHF